MKTISLVNHKGGVGKSTFATNIATYYANKGKKVMLGDFDLQQSSYNWLNLRPADVPKIEIMSYDDNGLPLVPNDIDYLIWDSPAGITGSNLAAIINNSDKIIMPLRASSLDILSTNGILPEIQGLIKENYEAHNKQVDLAIVGNMTDGRTTTGIELKKFLESTGIYNPMNLREIPLYVHLVAFGLGLFDANHPAFEPDRKAWQPLFDWIDSDGDIEKHNPWLFA